MKRAGEIVTFRSLGFNLGQIARILAGGNRGLDPELAAHQSALQAQMPDLARTIERVQQLRNGLLRGRMPASDEMGHALLPD